MENAFLALSLVVHAQHWNSAAIEEAGGIAVQHRQPVEPQAHPQRLLTAGEGKGGVFLGGGRRAHQDYE